MGEEHVPEGSRTMVVSSTSLPPIFFSNHHHNPSPPHLSAPLYRLGLRRHRDGDAVIGSKTTKGHKLQVSSKKGSSKEVIMVDPLEAKRLAEKQMIEIQAKEKLKRKRQIEAINGAWAMIGLTAGLVVEGKTGNGILRQVNSLYLTKRPPTMVAAKSPQPLQLVDRLVYRLQSGQSVGLSSGIGRPAE